MTPGSIHGPTLITIHIEDLPMYATSESKKLPSDTKIHNDSPCMDLFKIDINDVVKWSNN